jgi:hypothetical protein
VKDIVFCPKIELPIKVDQVAPDGEQDVIPQPVELLVDDRYNDEKCDCLIGENSEVMRRYILNHWLVTAIPSVGFDGQR